ncbi:hypothetical protein DM02DRAFT_632683 [Periconia macrospinosa]|uniref:Uncharacterized protein n=1 Tax=Periconia macrospinosa TaxID=97972 RepID=A0A2V1DC82_9PLEO|nr:hypothetical protein DM02DRAFT_632683 [Periconia macrospinosa]
MPLASLPSELLVEILDHVDDFASDTRLQDIFNLCSIRPFIPAARSRLYYDPGSVIRERHSGSFSIHHLACLVRTVVQNPRLGALVRLFTFNFFYEYSTSFRISPQDEPFFIAVIKSMGLKLCDDSCFFHPAHKEIGPTLPALLLAHCPNVKTTIFTPEYALAHFFRCSPFEQRLCWWQMAFPNHRGLKKLTLWFEHGWTYDLADIACIFQLESLRELRLRDVTIVNCGGLLESKVSTALREDMSPLERLHLDRVIAGPDVLSLIFPCFSSLREVMYRAGGPFRPRQRSRMIKSTEKSSSYLSPVVDLVKKQKNTLRNLAIFNDGVGNLETIFEFPSFHYIYFCIDFKSLCATGSEIARFAPVGVQKLMIIFETEPPPNFGDFESLATLENPQCLPHLQHIYIYLYSYDSDLYDSEEIEFMDKVIIESPILNRLRARGLNLTRIR